MKLERKKNAIRNIAFASINKMVTLVCPFIVRTVIIYTLGMQYLGVSSLFGSILSVLNLAELGFSSALVFSMYKPIAEEDRKTICALMLFYRKCYRIIGTVILSVGLCLLPFLRYLVRGDAPADTNLYVLYLIYLFNTVITYFLFAYKNCLLVAHQRDDINSKVASVVTVLQYAIQISLLLIFKNYYIYIIVTPIFSITNNVVTAFFAERLYPEYKPKGELEKVQLEEIKKRVAGLMVGKICTVARNSFDSIIISAFLGLTVVAQYNNYYYIVNSVMGIMVMLTTSITAGIGNSMVTETEEKNFKDLRVLQFSYMWLSGWCTVCLLCLLEPFMILWVGEKNLMPFELTPLMCMYFYFLKAGDILGVYKSACGIWWEDRFRAIIESIANLILNYVLVVNLGVFGVVLSTITTILFINFFWGSAIAFKYCFPKHKVQTYMLDHAKYLMVTVLACLITYGCCSLVHIGGVIKMFANGIICIIVPNCIYFVIYRRSWLYDEMDRRILSGVKQKLMRRR